MAQDRQGEPVTDAVAQADRVAAARAVVYDNDGELIPPEQLDAAMEEVGVSVGENEDGTTAYENVPSDLPLAACHLAVDMRRDPAKFIAGEQI